MSLAMKQCPECHTLNLIEAKKCDECGHSFKPRYTIEEFIQKHDQLRYAAQAVLNNGLNDDTRRMLIEAMGE